MTQNSWNSEDPVQVAKGGIGKAATTAYAVQCGGTTSTSALQDIVSVGTVGQLLTSNGPGALPTFQTPAQSGFSAYQSATVNNVTGDGTPYTVIADTELLDIGGDYNNATGIFTAPVDGLYVFNGAAYLTNLGAGHVHAQARFITTDRQWQGNFINPSAVLIFPNNTFGLQLTAIIPLAANDTVNFGVVVFGSTLTVGVVGDATTAATWFTGYLLLPP